MVQQVTFPQVTQVNNAYVDSNSPASTLATKGYVDNTSNSLIYDTPGMFANASVASGNIVLTTAITAGPITSLQVQTTGAAGTETTIQQFISGRGVGQIWAFTGFIMTTFTIANSIGNTGQVTITFPAAVTFPTITAGTVLQFESVAPGFTPVRDLALGTNLTGTVANNSQGRATLTLNVVNAGVTQIVAGNNITLNPTTGTGVVTISSTGGGGTSGSAVNTGSIYVADNQALTVRVASNTPTSSTVAGSLAVTVDFGSVNITSTPWPPFAIPTGFNTQFLMLEAADLSWSGVGFIQTSPTNALTQISWIRKPTQAVGTIFAAARCWPVTAAISYSLVGSTPSDAQSRNPNSTLLFPELQVSQVSDTLGGNAARIITQPFIDGRISALVGSASGATFLTPLTAVVIINQGSSNVQLSIETLVDSVALAAQLNALGAAASFIGTTSNTLPDLPVTSWASTGVAGITLLVNLAPSVTLATAQAFFANVRINTIYYGATAQAGNYTFRPDPQAAIDFRAFNWGQNNLLVGSGLSKTVNTINQTVTLANSGVTSINAITGAANLVAGAGIGLSTSGQNITVTNTGQGSGISASNFTTFINDLGQSLGATGFVSFVSSADQTGWVGLGMDSDAAVNDGGFIGTTKYIGTTQGVAVSTYGYAPLFPVAATYTDLEIQVYIPAMVITFTSASSSGWDIEVYFSKASSTAAVDPGRNTNLFPGFRSGPSDLVSLNVLRTSPVVFAPVAGQANTYTATISGGGLYSAITNNYAHTDTTTGYLPWIRIDGPALTSITSVVINQSEGNAGNSGGFRALVAIPGSGGATPTLQQVLTIGNRTGNNAIVFQDATPSALSVSIQAPTTVITSYALRLPNAVATSTGQTFISDTSGNLSWGFPPITLTQVLTNNGTANNLSLALTGTGILTTPMLALSSASAAISLRAPTTGVTSYTLALPAAAPNYGNTLVTTDAAGNTAWQPAGLELIRLISTVNITASGAQTVDGVAVALNDIVLLQNQTTTTENGLYAVVLTGAWMRLTTYPSQSVFATAGTANSNRTYTRNGIPSPEQWILTGSASGGGGGGTPGGDNLSYQWNNSGAFAGDSALIRDTVNNRASVAAPIAASNIARLADVQLAASGIRPQDVQGAITNIAETNLAGTYTNNTGAGSATFSGTPPLTIAGRNVVLNEYVVLVGQTAQLQNGGYQATSIGYSLTWIFDGTASPNGTSFAIFSITNITGVQGNFTINVATGQTMAEAIATRPGNLNPEWGYTSTTNSITISPRDTGTGWTTTPTSTVVVASGVTWTGTSPVTNTFTPNVNFTLTRVPTAPFTGEYWVSTATGATNYGVSYVLTTPPTITVGTTNLVYNLFGVANPLIPNLQAVTNSGNTTTTGITIGQNATATDGLALGIGGLGRIGAGTVNLLAGTNANDFVAISNRNAATVNSLRITGSATGAPVIITTGGDANSVLTIRPTGTGTLNLGGDGQSVVFGTANTANYNTPLIMANGLTPTATTAGTSGQVLTSRGPNATPAWVTPVSPVTPVYSYGLTGDQTLPATPFTFNTTPVIASGTAFGSWFNSSTFTFSRTGVYLAVFSFNVVSGAADMSLVFNGVRVAGATGSGKQEVTGFGNVTATGQTFVVQNYVSAGFSEGQSFLTLVKLA